MPAAPRDPAGVALGFPELHCAGSKGLAAHSFQLHHQGAPGSFKGRRPQLKVFLISEKLSDPGRKVLRVNILKTSSS